MSIKKTKGVNKNVVAAISQGEYRDVLLNKKRLRHLMNRIQSKNHRVSTWKINKISRSSFDGKIFISNNGYDRFPLGYSTAS